MNKLTNKSNNSLKVYLFRGFMRVEKPILHANS